MRTRFSKGNGSEIILTISPDTEAEELLMRLMARQPRLSMNFSRSGEDNVLDSLAIYPDNSEQGENK